MVTQTKIYIDPGFKPGDLCVLTSMFNETNGLGETVEVVSGPVSSYGLARPVYNVKAVDEGHFKRIYGYTGDRGVAVYADSVTKIDVNIIGDDDSDCI